MSAPDPASVSPAARAEEIGALLDAYRDALCNYADADAAAHLWPAVVAARAKVDAVVAALVRERDEARRDSARLEWLDEKRHFLLIRPGVNRIGVSVGGWCWSRTIGGVEELALDIREAIDRAAGGPSHVP